MSKTRPKVVFFGTGPISLRALQTVNKLCTIEAVITKPDSTNHGKTISPPIKAWATEHNIRVFQPENKSSLNKLFTQENIQAQMGVLVDYGLIIEQSVINFFKRGIVNSHFSLLPKLRGADPITSAILQGLPETGVSLMELVLELDAGPIIAQKKINNIAKLNIFQLEATLMDANDDILEEYLIDYYNGKVPSYDQDDSQATMTHQLKKTAGEITADKPAQQVEREIRAYLGWPSSYFAYNDLRLSITSARIYQDAPKLAPLELAQCGTKLLLGTIQGVIEIESLKVAGKKEMTAIAFINGYRSKIKTIPDKV